MQNIILLSINTNFSKKKDKSSLTETCVSPWNWQDEKWIQTQWIQLFLRSTANLSCLAVVAGGAPPLGYLPNPIFGQSNTCRITIQEQSICKLIPNFQTPISFPPFLIEKSLNLWIRIWNNSSRWWLCFVKECFLSMTFVVNWEDFEI